MSSTEMKTASLISGYRHFTHSALRTISPRTVYQNIDLAELPADKVRNLLTTAASDQIPKPARLHRDVQQQ